MKEFRYTEDESGADQLPGIATPLSDTPTARQQQENPMSDNSTHNTFASSVVEFLESEEGEALTANLDHDLSADGIGRSFSTDDWLRSVIASWPRDESVDDALESIEHLNCALSGAAITMATLLRRIRESAEAAVDFIEDGAAPTDEPDFIDPTDEDDRNMRGEAA